MIKKVDLSSAAFDVPEGSSIGMIVRRATLYAYDRACDHGRSAHNEKGCVMCPCRRTYEGVFAEGAFDFPTIMVLCGSTRFVEDFNLWRKRLTQEGNIVLSIEIVTTQQYDEDPQHVNRQNKEMLDELHLRKIDLADKVMVLNVGGYIGDSTRREIAYATAHGKTIMYLEAINDDT